MRTYTILQLKKDKIHEKGFMMLSFIDKKFGGVKLGDYKLTYTGEIGYGDIDVILEELYFIFNCSQPKDFVGHSLSVGDIIEINEKNGDQKFYYCDSIGFKEILIKENKL